MKLKLLVSNQSVPSYQMKTMAIGITSECTKVSNEDDLQWKTTTKYGMWNISATTGWILLLLGSNQSVQMYKIKMTSTKDNLKT